MREKAKAVMQLKVARSALEKAKDSIRECAPGCEIEAAVVCRAIERLLGCVVMYAEGDGMENTDPDLSCITDED